MYCGSVWFSAELVIFNIFVVSSDMTDIYLFIYIRDESEDYLKKRVYLYTGFFLVKWQILEGINESCDTMHTKKEIPDYMMHILHRGIKFFAVKSIFL